MNFEHSKNEDFINFIFKSKENFDLLKKSIKLFK